MRVLTVAVRLCLHKGVSNLHTHCCVRFEPFVLTSRALLPPFDARFRGYGQDRVSWARLLHGSGFRCCSFGVGLHLVDHLQLLELFAAELLELLGSSSLTPTTAPNLTTCPAKSLLWNSAEVFCRFAVHPGAFLLHRPHAPSPAQTAWVASLSHRTRTLAEAAPAPLQV